jgi:frataxin
MSGDGVLQIQLGNNGTFIVSRQTPSRQLWLSSPVSGPWHFTYDNEKDDWICTKGKDRFWDRMNKEISPILKIKAIFK